VRKRKINRIANFRQNLQVKEFEKVASKQFNKINVGAQDNAIGFYKSIGYQPFLLIQFKKETYGKQDFPKFEILNIKD